MGTDIHFFVEKKVNGKWVSVDKWQTEHDSYYGPQGYKHVSYKDAYYDSRNYDAFAILANVRNGSGFAGCDTGDGFNVIAMPRGYPDDMSPELQEYTDKYTEHTPTWLLLSEVLAFDWTQVTVKRGVVGIAEYWDFVRNKKREGEPYSYCGGVSGPGVKHVTNAKMDEVISRLSPEKKKELDEFIKDPEWGELFKRTNREKEIEYYTVAEWKEDYKTAAGDFYTETIPRLKAMSEGKPENIRMVFYFDS